MTTAQQRGDYDDALNFARNTVNRLFAVVIFSLLSVVWVESGAAADLPIASRSGPDLPIVNPRFIPKPGIGTKANLPANIDDMVKVGRPIKGQWPAIMKDGKVYVDQFHSFANKRANGGIIGPEDAYGMATLDEFGTVISVSW